MLPVIYGADPALRRHLSAEHLKLLLEKAEGFGLSSTTLLRQCNLSYNLEDLRHGRIEMIPRPAFARILELCVREIMHHAAPPGFKNMSRLDFDFMCHASISSATLREVIDRHARFLDFCAQRYGRFQVEEQDGNCAIGFILGPVERCWESFFLMNAFQVFARYHCWIIAEPIPMSFELKCERSDEAERIADLFGLPVTFSAQADRIVFPSIYLDKPVVRDAQELRQLLQNYPFDISPPQTDARLSTRVASVFQDAMVGGRELPRLEQVAQRMGMGNATFRRRLAAEGETIRSIKERVRTDVALKMLAAQDVHPDQIGAMLGFSSAKAFSRAFVNWSGLTPVAYRRKALSQHESGRRDLPS